MPLADQGAKLPRYTIIPRTLIFLTRGDCVLLLKGAPNKRLWANQYNGVGGHIEPGEDVLSAARRELREETGLEADLRLCGVVMIDTQANPGIGIFVMKGECPSGEPAASCEGTLEWLYAKELSSYPLVEDLSSLLPRVLAMEATDPPFFARYSYDAEDRLIIEFG